MGLVAFGLLNKQVGGHRGPLYASGRSNFPAGPTAAEQRQRVLDYLGDMLKLCCTTIFADFTSGKSETCVWAKWAKL
jgi:hypothetical protein